LATSICVIFDLDGTLVDSEILSSQAFLDLLPEIRDPVQTLLSRYRGRKLSVIVDDLQKRYDLNVPADFEIKFRERVSELMAKELRPISGVREMLERINHERCIASSGPLPKIRMALEITGLGPYFGDRLFSSYEINSWKPDPGLFLHTAQAMRFKPDRCVVIEDSEIGMQAAVAAGMRAFCYAPDPDACVNKDYSSFHSMSELPALLNQIE
jgi:HAD superfamily hydrolase (TIGR01509 family)